MNPEPGTYALILRCFSRQVVSIGKLGNLHAENGCYVYVGSAFGSGGVRARIRHHLKISVRPHWHMDYLRPVVEIKEVWYSHAPGQMEHQWAVFFNKLKYAAIPLTGFGSSDCGCESHLFSLEASLDLTKCRMQLADSIPGCGEIKRIKIQLLKKTNYHRRSVSKGTTSQVSMYQVVM